MPDTILPGFEAFDHLATMVAVARPDWHCLLANSTLENVMGLSRRTLLRGNVVDWLVDPAPLREALRLVSGNEVASGRFDALMRRLPMGSGELPVHVIVSQMDRTDRVLIELIEIEQQTRLDREERAHGLAQANKELVRNLVDNAINYTPAAGPDGQGIRPVDGAACLHAGQRRAGTHLQAGAGHGRLQRGFVLHLGRSRLPVRHDVCRCAGGQQRQDRIPAGVQPDQRLVIAVTRLTRPPHADARPHPSQTPKPPPQPHRAVGRDPLRGRRRVPASVMCHSSTRSMPTRPSAV